LALEMALRFDGEIVNADSMQIYRELSVLTARPSARDMARVPHHLYGILGAAEACSAGMWLDLAVARINDIHQRGRLAIVCGGTGLYLKVLGEGMAQIPEVPAAIVSEAEALYRTLGGDGFLQRLAALDAPSAARLRPSDRQRLVRAFAVAQATGKSLSDWQGEQSAEPPVAARFFTLHLMPERAALYQKIEGRFEAMLEMGGLEEVRKLSELSLNASLPAMKALGVPELIAVLQGDLDMEAALARAKQTTRNLAKRQFTWFRNQGAADLVLADFGANVYEPSFAALSEFLKLKAPVG